MYFAKVSLGAKTEDGMDYDDDIDEQPSTWRSWVGLALVVLALLGLGIAADDAVLQASAGSVQECQR